MTEDEKIQLRSAAFQHLIFDPYPKYTECWQYFGWQRKPWEISPHQAWQDGFNFCRSLYEKKLFEMAVTPWIPPSTNS